MAKTRKTLQLKNLAKYDVLITDTSPNSTYFNVSNIPQVFTGGRNSFLIGGSLLLKRKSTIQIEILDSNGIPIFQNPVKKYIEGDSRLVTVEISDIVTPGFCTIILMGEATSFPNGNPIPSDWQTKYNVRWTTQVLVEPNRRNVSPLVFKTLPVTFSEEQRLYSVETSSYTSSSVYFTASLTPTLFSGYPFGYLISAESPTTFSAEYNDGYITGALKINNVNAELYLPINDILNKTTAFSTGRVIKTTEGKIVDKLYLTSGSYTTVVFTQQAKVTSSARLIYSKLTYNTERIPISYAKIRVINLDTVSGEIYKVKVYSKVPTTVSDYKLIADIPIRTSELLTTSSIYGNLPIGDFYFSPLVSSSWYSNKLESNLNPLYPLSGSPNYYSSSVSTTNCANGSCFNLNLSDDTLLRAIQADIRTIPLDVDTTSGITSSRFSGSAYTTGYFIGNVKPVTLFTTSEYTLQLDAIYKKNSGSIKLTEGLSPKVDIYIVGVNGTKTIGDDPLGQKIGTMMPNDGVEIQWYQDKEFNFTPALVQSGPIGIRFVITNGFWHFSEISLKPASDKYFAPDEIEVLVPNTEYTNQLIQHKVEFFDINNNSTDIFSVSSPTFFTGSNIDLGTLP